MEVQVVTSITKVGQEEWDECAIGSGEVNPFLLWAFFHALEDSGSAVADEGWLPQHVLVRNQATRQLLGVCPMYLKSHSYGEYVFDHSWAGMYSRAGMRYYPKLQSCVPFTPVTGRRMLLRPGPYGEAVANALAGTLVTIADQLGVSSLHMTFNTQQEWGAMRQQGYLCRTGIQYHWDNQQYSTFDDFLMDLKQSKRKNIRQERKKVVSEGLRVRRLTGDDIKSDHWDAFYRFYLNTVDRKWGSAYLTRDFFFQLGETMADKVLLVVADDGEGSKPVAAALNMIGSDALFGRNWGCARDCNVKNLHFELCYYQAIEAAIELRLPRVEAGAQGEHKIQRGYLPTMTYSSHYIRDDMARQAVDRFLRSERAQVEYTLEALNKEASPYKER